MNNFVIKKILFLGLLAMPLAMAKEGGGERSGGGDIQKDPSVSTSDIEQIIRENKNDLRVVVYSHKWEYDRIRSNWGIPLDKKLFGGVKTIGELIDQSDVEVEMNQPCYDENGTEVDASIHAFFPGAICISAYRIAPKLFLWNARAQTLGLIAHELSHLLGASEDEAKEYQGRTVRDLKQVKSGERLSHLHHLLSKMIDSINDITKSIKTYPDEWIAEQFEGLSKKTERYTAFSIPFPDTGDPFTIYNLAESAYFRYQSFRFLVAYRQFLFEISGGKDFKKFFDRVFQGKNKVSYGTFIKLSGEGGGSRYQNEIITRPKDRNEMIKILESFEDFLRGQKSYVWRLWRNAWHVARPKLPGQSYYSNPWEYFVGKYKVISQKCKTNNGPPLPSDEIGFTVLKTTNGIELKGVLPNDERNFGGVYTGARDPQNDNSTIVVGGDSEKAKRISEFGSIRGKIWTSKSFELKKTNIGEYELLKRRFSRTNASIEKAYCIFMLSK